MLNIIVFVIALTTANLATAMILIMVATSKWYSNKVMDMTKNMMENIAEMNE